MTGLYCFSISGGKFGDGMKKTGYDVISITGKADEPVYLYIDDQGKVDFKKAEHLWGLDTERTQEFIRAETSPAAGITCIGPAGEKMVPYACLINERRALGRGGAGAVMGAKNLKAVVVRGNLKTEVADPQGAEGRHQAERPGDKGQSHDRQGAAHVRLLLHGEQHHG